MPTHVQSTSDGVSATIAMESNSAAEEAASILDNATNPCFESISLSAESDSTRTHSIMDMLYSAVAMRAVFNTGGRAEEDKCHPGTRKEVIDLIEKWMDGSDGDERILWLSGPPGAGKTAIVSTIAERAKDRGVDTANFFFSRGDSTRNHEHLLVTTLLYQIVQLYPAAHDVISSILSGNPLLLEADIDTQLTGLMYPLCEVIHKSDPDRARMILLVDGLEECDLDSKRRQSQILQILHSLVVQRDSPFLLLIASRPEAHIRITFEQLPSPVQSIFLDQKYSPDKDIRIFVTAEFRKIKKSHPSAHLLKNDWPTMLDIDAIVMKSCGQFIYAAAVMRFLSDPSVAPSLNLERIHGMAYPSENSPFAHLDAMYIHIFSVVDDHEATQDILAAREFHERHFNYAEGYTTTTLKRFLRHYNSRYTDMLIESCLSELTAIIQHRDDKLVFYHASLSDFLLDKSRSDHFYLNLDAFCAQVFPVMWRRCIGSLSFSQAHPVGFGLLHYVEVATPDITDALLAIHPSQLMHNYSVGWDTTSFLVDISRLYYPGNLKAYKRIAKKWIFWSLLQDRINIDHFHDFCEPIGKSLTFRPSHEVNTHESKPTIAFGRRYLLEAQIYKGLRLMTSQGEKTSS